MSEAAPLKKCFKCGNSLPRSEFYRHPQMSDGLLGKCKECAKQDVISNRKRKISYYKEYDRLRNATQKRREDRNERSAKWSLINPVKRKANIEVGNAVRDGRIVKPEACEECGIIDRIEGHHCDYSKPLDVMWLCNSCHKQWHQKNGEGING